MYWALGEIIRAEAGILDTDSSHVAWSKLLHGIEKLGAKLGQPTEEPADRRAALIGRLVGIEAPPDVPVVEVEDPREMRERFFSAARGLIEGLTRRGPLVIEWEDIHWADDGMLDLIEYLAQWVGGPLLVLCLARDELLERRPNWGAGRRNATSIFLEPLTEVDTRALVAALMPAGEDGRETVDAVASRAGGNPLFAEEMARRLVEEDSPDPTGLPDTVHGVLASRLDALDPVERMVVQHAAVVGERFWTGALERLLDTDSSELQVALRGLEAKEIVQPAPEGAQRLASAVGLRPGDREYAFKHVLVRDVAYGTLPKARRSEKHFQVGSFIEERAGDRSEEVVALVAEHLGRAAVLAEEASLPAEELRRIRGRALQSLEAAGDAAAAVYATGEAGSRYGAALDLNCDDEPGAIARIAEKRADLDALAGRVEEATERWSEVLEHYEREGDDVRVADLHRKIGAALWQRGEREAAVEHYQAGINLLRDGEPCRELVDLYEEAATLYLNTGDNMLAVYASERALRLASRLAEPRAASRAYGIFGRVFGRIGDRAKARENLERSVELARGSSPPETIRALMALGDYLEVSEADYGAARRIYEEALAIAQEIGDLPPQVELNAHLALIAAYHGEWEEAERFTHTSTELAEREGLMGKLCFPYALQGLLKWRAGDYAEAERRLREAYEMARQVGWSEIEQSTLTAIAMTRRDRGDLDGAVQALDAALEVCERAGLIAQSLQTMSSRAIVLERAGRLEEAHAAAADTEKLADRLPYPTGRAAALTARGATSPDPDEGIGAAARGRGCVAGPRAPGRRRLLRRPGRAAEQGGLRREEGRRDVALARVGQHGDDALAARLRPAGELARRPHGGAARDAREHSLAAGQQARGRRSRPRRRPRSPRRAAPGRARRARSRRRSPGSCAVRARPPRAPARRSARPRPRAHPSRVPSAPGRRR